MAVQRRLNCSPEQVFAVLRDGWTYPVWVVGASRMRSVDEGWPAPGSKLHHSFGAWPLLLNDTTVPLIPDRDLGARWFRMLCMVYNLSRPPQSYVDVGCDTRRRGVSRAAASAARAAFMPQAP